MSEWSQLFLPQAKNIFPIGPKSQETSPERPTILYTNSQFALTFTIVTHKSQITLVCAQLKITSNMQKLLQS
jgi:hypothetical protein